MPQMTPYEDLFGYHSFPKSEFERRKCRICSRPPVRNLGGKWLWGEKFPVCPICDAGIPDEDN